MLGLAVLSGIALLGVVGYHMVMPNMRDLRLSMAHLLPDPPQSQAPKRTFSIRSLIASKPFWLRLLCVALIGFALFRIAFPFSVPQAQDRHMRLVIDVSGSMAVADGNETRIDLARRVAETALADIRNLPGTPACIDIAMVSGGVQVIPEAEADRIIASLTARPEGSGIATLFAAFTAPSPTCVAAPSHLVVITDQPTQPVPLDADFGHVIWHQVGTPEDNLAIADIALRAGTLRDIAPEITLQVTSFGARPATVDAIIQIPTGRNQFALRRDAAHEGGWIVALPFTGPGEYVITLTDGGALSLDDTVRFILGPLDRVAVDWQLPGIRRPAVFAQPGDDMTAITIAPYAGPNAALPDGPFVLTYAGWPGGASTEIGPYMRDHPVLAGLNFDVFESNAPAAQIVGETQPLNSVIRPNAMDGTWVAVRDSPRGVIVPQPANNTANIDAMSRLMFYNAIFWVAQDAAPAAPAFAYLNAGQTVPDATAESNTARTLGAPPSYALLREPPLAETARQSGEDSRTWTPWIIALALLVMLAERTFGLDWSRRRAGDV